MHCAGCVGSVEKALLRSPGVQAATVNLATARATLLAARADFDAQAAIRAVRAAGYEADEIAAGDDPTTRTSDQRAAELAAARRRLLIGAIAGVPVVVPHLWHALAALSGNVHAAHVTLGGLLGVAPRVGFAIEAALAGVVLIALAGNMIAGAVRALRARSANMDVLVALGVLTAYTSGIGGLIFHAPRFVLFGDAAMIALFVAVGKYLELRARGRASAALEALFARLPVDAALIVGDQTTRVATERLAPGDRVRVAAHEPIPTDGVVESGHITVDESMLTGESLPAERGPGDVVLGGTRVEDGAADLRVTAVAAESAAARIARLVEHAQTTKPPWQRVADRIAAVFVPVVIALAAATFLGWALAGTGSAPDRLLYALERAVAALVIACPCAMGLAIPTAVLVGVTHAAELGILVRDPAALEALARIDDVMLDKTGTLTIGRPGVTEVVAIRGGDADALAIAAAVARPSGHPLSKAIAAAAAARNLPLPTASAYRSAVGAGLYAELAPRAVALGGGRSAASNPATAPAAGPIRVWLGSAAWMRANGVATDRLAPRADAISTEGKSVVWLAIGPQAAFTHDAAPPRVTSAAGSSETPTPKRVAWASGPCDSSSQPPRSPSSGPPEPSTIAPVAWASGPCDPPQPQNNAGSLRSSPGEVVALIALSDELHPDARSAVASLHALRVQTAILSGDREAAAAAVARQLFVDRHAGDLSPADKLERVHAAVAAGRRVAFVGDGVNDAAALNAATVGIAIGAGADVAREAADICLVGHAPGNLPRAITLSRRSLAIMRQNLAWAFGYNLLMLPIAILTPLPPAAAALAMMFSSFSVVLNSLRLRRAAS